MSIEVLADGESDEGPSLYRWLREESAPEFAVAWVRSEPNPGQMGTLGEIVIVALSGGGAATVLARSMGTWLHSRRADITIKIKNSSGTFEIKGNRIKDPLEIIKEIAAVLPAEDEDESA